MRGSGESGLFYVKVKYSESPSGISTISRGDYVYSTEYYDLSGRRLAEPQRGINIRVERMSNGQTVTSKVIK